MLLKTRGIALHCIKYGDNSIIANVYTELFGRQAFMVKGIHGKKAGMKANLFAPLNLLELEVYHKKGHDIQQLKEAINMPAFNNIHTNPAKNAIAFFVAEVLYRMLREEEPNSPLYEFLHSAFQILDIETTKEASNFHLVFLAQLSKYVGFLPLNNFSATHNYFDLLNGSFVSEKPSHRHVLQLADSEVFTKLFQCTFETSASLQIGKQERFALLEKLIGYYKLHIPGMGKINSLQVLREVFE